MRAITYYCDFCKDEIPDDDVVFWKNRHYCDAMCLRLHIEELNKLEMSNMQ